jgi:hypothetical protein
MADLTEFLQAEAAAIKAVPPKDEQIGQARAMAEDLYQTDLYIHNLEKELQEAKDKRKEIVQRTFPQFLDNIGLDKVGLAEYGVDMVVEAYYHANIPEEKQVQAFQWLEDNGHDSLIKLTLTISLNRGDYDFGKKLQERVETFLSANKVKATVQSKLGVPWNTLTAFVREQTEAGVALPLDLLGATIGRIVKIKQRKK